MEESWPLFVAVSMVGGDGSTEDDSMMSRLGFNPRPRTAGDSGSPKRLLYSYLERLFREPDRPNVLAEGKLRSRRC